MSIIQLSTGDLLTIIVAFGSTVFFSVRFAVSAIIRRMDTFELNINEMHKRLDRHIVDWHKGERK